MDLSRLNHATGIRFQVADFLVTKASTINLRLPFYLLPVLFFSEEHICVKLTFHR